MTKPCPVCHPGQQRSYHDRSVLAVGGITNSITMVTPTKGHHSRRRAPKEERPQRRYNRHWLKIRNCLFYPGRHGTWHIRLWQAVYRRPGLPSARLQGRLYTNYHRSGVHSDLQTSRTNQSINSNAPASLRPFGLLPVKSRRNGPSNCQA